MQSTCRQDRHKLEVRSTYFLCIILVLVVVFSDWRIYFPLGDTGQKSTLVPLVCLKRRINGTVLMMKNLHNKCGTIKIPPCSNTRGLNLQPYTGNGDLSIFFQVRRNIIDNLSIKELNLTNVCLINLCISKTDEFDI